MANRSLDVAGAEFREEMEQSARLSGEGWKTTLGSVQEVEAFFRAWIPDPAARQWFATKLASSAQPIETFRQSVRLSNSESERVPRTFIRCPVDGDVWAHIYDPIVERVSRDKRWGGLRLATNHVGPVAAPRLVADALLDTVSTRQSGV